LAAVESARSRDWPHFPGKYRSATFSAAASAPASAKLQFLGKSVFIPIFFIVTGFLIDPVKFVYELFDNFLIVSSIIGALLAGKWAAAWLVGRANGYVLNAQLTVWSLTLPQVAATLAATLVAHETFNAAGERLLDDRMLNVVLVLVLTTPVLGPVLTERFALRMGVAPTGQS
jgi:Kef-type K+ transport system membrane component KefB